MKEAIRCRARELGFDDCRVTSAEAPGSATQFEQWLERGWHGQMAYLQRNAGKRIDPARVLPGARSIIALASSYARDENRDSPVLLNNTAKQTRPSGVIARYARFADYHDVLAQRLKQLTAFINQFGAPATNSLWYVDTGPVLERDLAQRAGLGFIGKHTNVISRRLGNWMFLSEILTTLELEPDSSEKNRCGSCSRCLSACPTGAIRAPFQLDARLCISYLTIELKGSIPMELRPAVGNRIFGCDDCLAACPWNRFAQAGRLMQEHVFTKLDTPDLLELLALDEPGFKTRFAGTPIIRTKRRGLLRNVCVALGNIGDASALPALQHACEDQEPVIAEHARWAVEQIETRGRESQTRRRTN